MAPRRLVISCNDPGGFFLLVEGDTVTIGKPGADGSSVLQQLRVNNVHCVLDVEGEQVTVRDDVAETPGPPRPLQAGTAVAASGARLCLGAAAAADEVGLLPVGDTSAPAASDQPTNMPRLDKRFVVIDGADKDQVFPLPASGNVTFGKDRKHADYVLHDLYVARIHCLLQIEGDRVEAIDEGNYGILVNGQRVARQVLGLGDVLRIGNSHMRLEVALAGEEVARLAGPKPGALGNGVNDDEPIEVVVEDDDAGDEVEVVEDEDVEEEALPAGASEPVRLLQAWRNKLAQLSGQTFGHYRIGPLLGRGRCGVVFRADDLKTSKPVALKVFSPQFPSGSQELERFARVMKGLLPLRHPHLVALVGAGKTGTYTWVAREYVEGQSLSDLLRRLAKTGKFDQRRACRVALHLGQVLDFARGHQFRHGKVTPANILIHKTSKTLKLADLMLGAVLEGSQLAQAVDESRPLAELGYLAPEQADAGAFVDELSDLYGLGAVVFALLTGRPPFVGDCAEEILEQVRCSGRVPRPAASTMPCLLRSTRWS